MDVERELRRLMDERDVADVMRRYAHGLDRADWDQVAACFHPVGTIEGLVSPISDWPLPAKLAVGALTGLAFAAWLTLGDPADDGSR